MANTPWQTEKTLRAIEREQANRVRREKRAAAKPQHDLSAWDCNEPYDGATYGGRSCPVCGPERLS